MGTLSQTMGHSSSSTTSATCGTKKLEGFEVEERRDAFDGLECEIAFAAFDASDIGPV